MQDAMNALQSYLDTLNEKGFVFNFRNINNKQIILVVFMTNASVSSLPSFTKGVDCTEGGVSDLLESVENYVETLLIK
ncbi:hypothetical protein [Myroides odoratimimus]|uniref:hypothetical protein n=1 Tax=Myroides odoratimimus TaxID=76832 RepID=UPI002576A2AC|nr:hypothetical protein [Myroides odoratimimus]MDM1452202.1 hypothetical protein [Myroides odoratimimus]MDM1475459.1 hypothetical protein [Myroides odoratimimus]MDM1488254.1 hypothetical protein [Myroides odoratimimus]MEC4083540.1 hypothetical protein [Myroides odoratimimus]